MANFSTITDDFDDNSIGAIWTGNYGTYAETGQKAQVTYGTGYSGWATSGIYTFDSILADIVIPTTGTNDMSFAVGSSGQAVGTELAFYLVGSSGLLYFANAVGYTDAGAPTVTYSATTHKWLKLELSGTNVIWSTSPDGITWTARRTITKPSWLPASDCFMYYEGHRSSGTGTGTMDNFNLPPTGHITSGTGTITLGASGTTTGTHTTSGTGMLTLGGSGISTGGTGTPIPLAPGSVRGYILAVDWSGAGTYTGTLENVSSYVDRGDIAFGWGRSTDNPTSLAAPSSEMSWTLRNRDRSWDRYFSPENTLSPISGDILPGKAVQFTRTVGGFQSTRYTESFTTNAAGWTTVGGGTVSRVATPSEDGSGSLQYVPPGAVASVGVVGATRVLIFALAEGTFIASFRIRSSAGWATIVPHINWYDAAGAFISTSGDAILSVAAGVWTTVQTGDEAPPSTAAYATTWIAFTGTPPGTNTFNIDNVRLQHTANDAGKTYVLRQDVLDDFEIDSVSVARTFAAKSMDAWGRDDSEPLSTPVYTGIRTGDAINIILDEIGWPADKRAIDPGVTYIRYWWEEGTDPASAVDKIVNSEGPPAIAYVEAGIFVFRDRHHRILSPASNTPQGLFTHTYPAGPQGTDYKVKRDSFIYNHGVKDIVNAVSFSLDIRNPAPMQEVWANEDPILMDLGEVRIFTAQPNDPVISAVTPNFDDGSLQGAGDFTVTMDRTSGQTMTIIVTAVSGGIITRVAVNAMPLPVTRTVQITASDEASKLSRGRKAWPNPAPWCNPYDAQAIADRIVSVYADNRPRVTFTLVNFNERYLSKILSLRIGDRITVKNDLHGVNRDFHVERLEHRVSRLLMHEVTVTAVVTEPVQASNAFMFDVGGRGFNDGAFAATGIDNASTMFVFDQSGQGFDQGLFAN